MNKISLHCQIYYQLNIRKMVITAAVLRESHAARNSELAQIGSTEVIEIIDGVKSIKFALWSPNVYF